MPHGTCRSAVGKLVRQHGARRALAGASSSVRYSPAPQSISGPLNLDIEGTAVADSDWVQHDVGDESDDHGARRAAPT